MLNPKRAILIGWLAALCAIGLLPSRGQAAPAAAQRLVNVATVDGKGSVIRARKGDVIRIGDAALPIHYRGAATLTWELRDRVLRINGAIKGVDLSGLPARAAAALVR
ncbi:MAG: hypothetical protein ABI333_02680, partial [bacterium]